jgi:hypothetical protein
LDGVRFRWNGLTAGGSWTLKATKQLTVRSVI